MLFIALTLSLASSGLTLPPMVTSEGPSIAQTPRSVSLLEQETLTLERRVKSASRMLPVWVPLVAGLGVGAGCFALGVQIFAWGIPASLAGVGAAFGGALLLCAGPLVAIAGIVTAIVFAVKNGGARRERLEGLQLQLAQKKAELAEARELVPLATF